jgi:hypothetical protein
MKKRIVLTAMLVGTVANAGLLFNYSQLKLKDIDSMSKMISSKIEESRKAGGDQTVPLKECLQAVYSRPNEDFMIDKVIGPLKSELEDHNAWESSVQKLTKEAIGALQHGKAFRPVVQVTYTVFLENILADQKPTLDKPFSQKLVQQIRDAKIEITKEAENERRMRVMTDTTSPSEIADRMLKEYDTQKAAAAAAAKAASAGDKDKKDAPATPADGAKKLDEIED